MTLFLDVSSSAQRLLGAARMRAALILCFAIGCASGCSANGAADDAGSSRSEPELEAGFTGTGEAGSSAADAGVDTPSEPAPSTVTLDLQLEAPRVAIATGY